MQRQQILKELISTERTYVTGLNLLSLHYLSLFYQVSVQASAYRVTEDEVVTVIMNIETLTKFHNILLRELEKADALKLPAILLSFAPTFKLYTGYLNSYEKCLQVLDKWKNNAKISTVLARTKENLLRESGLDLMSFLIMPVQRLPRYVMLLQTLKKHSPDVKIGMMEEALQKISEIVEQLNAGKRAVEQQAKLLELSDKITNFHGALIVPHRTLIREGELQEITGSKKKKGGGYKFTERRLFLFSDILLWTKGTSFKGVISLSAATANAVDVSKKADNSVFVGQDPTDGFIFEVSSSQQYIAIYTSSASERETWVSALCDAIATAKSNRVNKQKVKNMQRGDSNKMHFRLMQNLHEINDKASGNSDKLSSRSVSKNTEFSADVEDRNTEFSADGEGADATQQVSTASYSSIEGPKSGQGPSTARGRLVGGFVEKLNAQATAVAGSETSTTTSSTTSTSSSLSSSSSSSSSSDR